MNKTDFTNQSKKLPVVDFLRGYPIFTIVLMHFHTFQHGLIIYCGSIKRTTDYKSTIN